MWILPCICKPKELVVFPYFGDEADAERSGVLVYPTGEVTNRWSDGTVGVPDWIVDLAKECENAYCPQCLSEANWEADTASATTD